MDSLPYIDHLDESYEKKALDLIQAEMKGRSKPSLPPIPPSAFSKERNNDAPKFTPASTIVEPPKDDDDVKAWERAVKRARIAYENERIVSLQLAVDTHTATDVFRTYNTAVREPRTAAFEQLQQEQKSVVEKLNYQRQIHQQEKVGPELQVLKSQFAELIAKQYPLREAIRELEEKLQDS